MLGSTRRALHRDPGRFELDLDSPELVNFLLQLGETLVIACGNRHLVVQSSKTLVETGDLLFQTSEIFSGLAARCAGSRLSLH